MPGGPGAYERAGQSDDTVLVGRRGGWLQRGSRRAAQLTPAGAREAAGLILRAGRARQGAKQGSDVWLH